MNTGLYLWFVHSGLPHWDFFCICSVSCVLCFLCLWILYSSFFVVFLMCLVPNVVFVSGLFTLDSFFGIFLSSFVVLCQIFPVYLDCSLVIASLEGFLSSFCVLCPKLPLSLDYSLLMTSSGFINRTKKKNPQKTKHRKQKRDEDHGPHLR
jgi:hypothetical protein